MLGYPLQVSVNATVTVLPVHSWDSGAAQIKQPIPKDVDPLGERTYNAHSSKLDLQCRDVYRGTPSGEESRAHMEDPDGRELNFDAH